MLKTPEYIFCHQDELRTEKNDFMYFIAKGKCEVRIRDKFNDRYEEKVARILTVGDHFGVSSLNFILYLFIYQEIGMLYRCNRSATVISKNYCTCAEIGRTNYNELLQIYPTFNEIIKTYINTYDDPLKIFLEISLNQVDFFVGLNKQIKNEWIFIMKQRVYEKGSLLYKIDTESEEMYVL